VQLERDKQRNRERQQRAAPVDNFDPYEITKWHVVAGTEPGYLPHTSMRKGANGFYLPCRACGQQFESKGMAYCLSCLELPAEERRQMQPVTMGRLCQAPGCENFLPRRARADVRYCSKACGQRARYADNHAPNLADNPAALSDSAPPKNLADNGEKDQ
jgi:hypothetical protein